MATINKVSVDAILWPYHEGKEEKFPIKICITINGDRKYIGLGIKVSKSMWDGKQVKAKHPESTHYNTKIREDINAIHAIIDERKRANKEISSTIIKELATTKRNRRASPADDVICFFRNEVAKLEGKRETATTNFYTYIIRHLEEYMGGEQMKLGRNARKGEKKVPRPLPFSDLTETFLIDYEKWLRQRVTNNTVHSHFTMLQTWISRAHEKGLNAINPMADYVMPVFDREAVEEKEYLDEEEIDQVFEILTKLDGNDFAKVAWFLFACHTGLRVSDWMRFDFDKNVSNARLTLRAKKNGELISIPMTPRLKQIVDICRNTSRFKSRNTFNRIGEVLRQHGIKKKITTHCGRKTFAVTMCAGKGIALTTCAELMGITVTVCEENYYRITKRRIDAEVIEAWSNQGAKVIDINIADRLGQSAI